MNLAADWEGASTALSTWIVPLSTVVLVLVTAWYAVLTRRLAKSAEASAASAERTVQIAAQALAATVAAVDVQFEVSPSYQYSGGDDLADLGVTVFCGGATVFVHKVHLDSASEAEERSEESTTYRTITSGASLDVFDEEARLPVRLHRGESANFICDPLVRLPFATSVAILEVTVWYTLDGTGVPLKRSARYDDYEEHLRATRPA